MPEETPAPTAPKITPFKILFLIVLTDMIGFGIVLPLLPLYALKAGGSPLQATLLVSAYSICQLIASPMLGSLSDRVGRRPVLIFSQAGSALASITLAVATAVHFGNPLIALSIIYASRIVDGFSGGNLSVAQACVSDMVEPQHKAKFMGLLGAAFGIGFALGPGIGGLLASIHPAFAPLMAACFSITAATLSYLKLPESLREESVSSENNVLRSFRLMREPILAQINLVWFLTMFAFVTTESVFALFLADRFQFSPREIGAMFTLAGVVIIIMQGGLIGPLTRKFGEWNLATYGPLIFAAAMLLYTHIAVHPVVLLLICAAIGNAIGRSLQTPSLSVIISHQAKGNQQGAVFGLFQGFGALARVFGPAVAGAVYENGHYSRPFAMAGIVITAATLWTVLIRVQLPTTASHAGTGTRLLTGHSTFFNRRFKPLASCVAYAVCRKAKERIMTSSTYERDRNDALISEVVPVAIKAAAIGAGAVLALELYRHRRLIAVASAFAGALMWTNRILKDHAPSQPRRTYRPISGSASFPGEHIRPATQTPVDELDEALMESFPASDPPASSRR